MNDPRVDMVCLAHRLDRLERQNRRFKFGTCALAVVAGAVFLMGSQDADKATHVSATQLGLKDAKGKERMRMSMGPEGPMINFLDDNGNDMASLGVSRQGVVLRYVGGRGQLISGVSLERSGVGLVNIDNDGKLQSGPNAVKPDAGLLGPRRQ
jgi:hypothetical protein